MALDPPTGCSFSALKPPKVKLEAIRAQLSNVKSTISSEWGAIRKVRVAPRIPPNGSLSHQSLAYLHAGTRYVKDVSGILKLGVTTLRSSSTSYEVVPGMQLEVIILVPLVPFSSMQLSSVNAIREIISYCSNYYGSSE